MAIADINASPNARSMTLVVEDGACAEKTARTAAKKLIAQDIRFLVGGACSEEVRGIALAMRGSETILLSPSATGDLVSNDNVFRLVPSLKQTKAAERARRQLLKGSSS